jgi:hypothetical protein
MSDSRTRIKTGKASLIGGIAVGVAVFILWTAIGREIGAQGITSALGGLVAAVAVAAWIRIADL